jgi:hypothetical protein
MTIARLIIAIKKQFKNKELNSKNDKIVIQE